MAAFTTGSDDVPLPKDFPTSIPSPKDQPGEGSLSDMLTDELLNNWQWNVDPAIFNEPYSDDRCDVLKALGAQSAGQPLGATKDEMQKLVIAVLEHEGRPYNEQTVSRYLDCIVQGHGSDESSAGLWIGLGIAAVAVGIFALTLRKK